ncbi:DEKNAAC100477 [Brettanomyces naardenensis]|uniref:DEKNAAC100477 n=1 Tax=Brettanomyces naardenensis TaxID=13370 RepID=A0A448YFB1_BRENA|nr:DEKNAAC100477 [Brettanomyces naardenensis]
MGIIRFVGRTAVASAFFAAGFAMCAHTWPPSTEGDPKTMSARNRETLSMFNSVQKSDIFQRLINDSRYRMLISSELIPEAHRFNHVGLGLMNSPKHLAVGPLVFINSKDGEMYSFCKLDSNLVGTDGKIHNGVISTLMDESLCFCGFPQLPSKRGVTAKLVINYYGKAAPDSMVLLVAKISEVHGRKCVIKGHIETFDESQNAPQKLADGECVLVQPKWFKYFDWVRIFD